MLRIRLSSGAGTIDPLKLVSYSCRPRLLTKRNLFCSPLEQTLAATRGTGSVLTECTVTRIMNLAECYSGDKFKNSELGVACGMYGGRERCVKDFRGETSRKECT
jgi:hypothetical protein